MRGTVLCLAGAAGIACAAWFLFPGAESARRAAPPAADALAVTAPALPPLPALPDAAVPVPQLRAPSARLSTLAGE